MQLTQVFVNSWERKNAIAPIKVRIGKAIAPAQSP